MLLKVIVPRVGENSTNKWNMIGDSKTLPTPVFLFGESNMDREAWQATVHEVTKSRPQLSD